MFDIPAFEMNKIKVEQFYKTYKSKLLGLLFFLTSFDNNNNL